MQNKILLSVILLIYIKSHVSVRNWQTVKPCRDDHHCTEGKNLYLLSLGRTNCPALAWIKFKDQCPVNPDESSECLLLDFPIH